MRPVCPASPCLLVRTVLADDEHVERDDAALLREAHLHAAVNARARAADVMLVVAADPHQHRRVGLLREQRRDDRGDRAGRLAAESTARVVADEHDVGRLEMQPARDRRDGLNRALRRAVQVQLAVLPVRHRGARLERLVAGVRRDERFVEHERRFLEAGLDVAVRPLVGRLAHRQRPWRIPRSPRSVHFIFGDVRRRRRLARFGVGAHPGVALRARVRPPWTQRVDRIDVERQRLPVDLDLLDRFERGQSRRPRRPPAPARPDTPARRSAPSRRACSP